MALSGIKGTLQEILSTVFDLTNGWLNVNLSSLIAGEDQTTHVLGTFMKPVASATYAPLRSNSFGTALSAVASTQPSAVVAAYASNANAAVRYFQLFNRATALAGGETPLASFPIPAGTTNTPGVLLLNSAFFAPSSYQSTGTVWAISTTNATYTSTATAADHNVVVRYVQ